MMKMKMRVLLVAGLLLTFLCRSSSRGVFVYNVVGGDVLLPCPGLNSSSPSPSPSSSLSPYPSPIPSPSSACSFVSWSFFTGSQVRYTMEVSGGQVLAESERAARLSVTAAGCSLRVREVGVGDAGSYGCSLWGAPAGNVYLSLLLVDVHTPVSDLRPGGRLVLSCLLFTYYDTGSCKPYTNDFRLSWRGVGGAPLTNHSRLELTSPSRCNVTLSTELRPDDRDRKWRCEVRPWGNGSAVFQDFTSAFLFHAGSADQAPPLATVTSCPEELPISRVALCVALPLMVVAVGIFTWWNGRRAPKHAAGIELREME